MQARNGGRKFMQSGNAKQPSTSTCVTQCKAELDIIHLGYFGSGAVLVTIKNRALNMFLADCGSYLF